MEPSVTLDTSTKSNIIPEKKQNSNANFKNGDIKIPYVKLYRLNKNDLQKIKKDQRDYSSGNKVIIEKAQPVVVLKRTKIFECKKCRCCFLRAKDYIFHKLKHATPIVSEFTPHANNGFKTRFKCEECDWRFVEKSTLEAHMVVHKPLPHICDCGIGFYLEKDLKAHIGILHRDKKRPMWKCTINYSGPKAKSDFCMKSEADDRNTVIKNNLDKINRESKFKKIKIDTVKEVSYQCSACNKTFPDKSHRDLHYNSVHLGLRLYSCKICNKAYTQISALNLHMNKHNGIKNFKCQHCNKRFLNKSGLAKHEIIHTGERPFACDYCPARFSDPSACQRHVRLHTGVKPYGCEKCDARFSDSSALRGHKKRQSCIKYSGRKKMKSKYDKSDCNKIE
ncbi:zinc finger protein 431-like [Galleria mellonella]|uniref:Zinc finger protein 431-like n=1 Tax=Galleria mellonella TaxID=7137 RepID=A0ABM3N7B0_GALME|nr:zinc finger protein 431-like [Galleria mellonella]XP_052759465.1 zinc finger protein 431-like [Galleria mellonella]